MRLHCLHPWDLACLVMIRLLSYVQFIHQISKRKFLTVDVGWSYGTSFFQSKIRSGRCLWRRPRFAPCQHCQHISSWLLLRSNSMLLDVGKTWSSHSSHDLRLCLQCWCYIANGLQRTYWHDLCRSRSHWYALSTHPTFAK